jgi:hypothetical protein
MSAKIREIRHVEATVPVDDDLSSLQLYERTLAEVEEKFPTEFLTYETEKYDGREHTYVWVVA